MAHLSLPYMLSAIRLFPASRITDNLHRIWKSLCVCLDSEKEVVCSGELRRIEIEAAVEATSRWEVSVLDLRFLVSEVFQASN